MNRVLSTCGVVFCVIALACSGKTESKDVGGQNDNSSADVPLAEDSVQSDLNSEGDTAKDSSVEEDSVEHIDWDLMWGSPDMKDDGKKRIIILHTNDLHAHLEGAGPMKDFSPNHINNDETLGGFSRLATLIERERVNLRPGADLIVVDAGDFSFGSAYAALARSEGTELKLMEKMGYTATTVGNHELDWSPAGLAEVVQAGIGEDDELRIVASNLKFSAESADDDTLEALMGDKILPYMVVQGSNGIKIGIFGLTGKGAYSLAPHAEPVEVDTPATVATEVVNKLRTEEGVDMVVCLSHGGVSEGGAKGEDETLAEKVDGINVIVSGHSHTLLEDVININNTTIVQAGLYGLYLGKLVLVETEPGMFVVESWETIPVDDSVWGRHEIQELTDEWESDINDAMFKGLPYGYHDTIAHTGFDIPTGLFKETQVGNLISDAVGWAVGEFGTNGPVDVAIEANGVIRDGFLKGQTGAITVGDVLLILPLGYGPDGVLGYPLLDFYVTANELRLALEVACGVAPLFADSFFLQASGVKFECDPKGQLFNQVTKMWLGNDVDGYSEVALDTSESNTKLYHIATNLYIGQMMSVLKGMTAGMLAIELKDKDGNVHENVTDFLVDTDPDTAGIQELKLWRAAVEYLRALPVAEGGKLPEVPTRYSDVAGRMVMK